MSVYVKYNWKLAFTSFRIVKQLIPFNLWLESERRYKFCYQTFMISQKNKSNNLFSRCFIVIIKMIVIFSNVFLFLLCPVLQKQVLLVNFINATSLLFNIKVYYYGGQSFDTKTRLAIIFLLLNGWLNTRTSMYKNSFCDTRFSCQ